MKKTSSVIVKMAVVLFAVFSLIFAGNAAYLPSNQNTKEIMTTQIDFYANITFTVYEGDGCGCVPLREAPINATGRDTDHSAFGVTDENGVCILPLEYDKTYRVSIQQPNHESVLFDFVVIDDQAFAFHMKEVEVSTLHFTFMNLILQKILSMRRIL
jgi:hypothetical protein